MKVVYQRAVGDCGIAALATLIEQSYEDVFVEAAKVEKRHRGRNGIYLPAVIKMAKALGVRLVRRRQPVWDDDDEGLLVVQWAERSRNDPGALHLVAVGHGVVIDPADGTVLPVDEYCAREQAIPRTFLEMQ